MRRGCPCSRRRRLSSHPFLYHSFYEPVDSVDLVARLGREPNAHVASVEHSELRLQENISVNRKRQPSGGLDAAKACRRLLDRVAVHRRELDNVARNDSLVSANDGSEGWYLGVAVHDKAADLLVVLGRRDLRVVGLDGLVGQEHQCRAGVCDGLVREVGGLAVAHGEAAGAELPEALGGVDGNKVDLASELGLVHEPEVVITSCWLKID